MKVLSINGIQYKWKRKANTDGYTTLRANETQNVVREATLLNERERNSNVKRYNMFQQ